MKSLYVIMLAAIFCNSVHAMETLKKKAVQLSEKGLDQWYSTGIMVKSELESGQPVDITPHGGRRYERAIESFIEYHKDASALGALLILYDVKQILPRINQEAIKRSHTFIIDESIKNDKLPELKAWLTFCKDHNITISTVEASKMKDYFAQCKRNVASRAKTQFVESQKDALLLKKLENEAIKLGAKPDGNESGEDDYTTGNRFYLVMTGQRKATRHQAQTTTVINSNQPENQQQ